MEDSRDLILKTLRERSCLKQDVYDHTLEVFNMLKEVCAEAIRDISEKFGDTDERVQFYFKDEGTHEAELKIAGDVLIFNMHTNVFLFDQSNSVWQTSYLKENETNGYVGVINIYNFLADSIKYQRYNDAGYLIARIFVNRENHFLVQGKRQLGYLYNDFIHAQMDKDTMRKIIDSALLYTMNFDLLVPPYQNVQEVSVAEIENTNHQLRVKTAKRLGFKFSFEDE